MHDFWSPDNELYTELQKLVEFVQFVAHLDLAQNEDKEHADQICQLIENMQTKEGLVEWHVSKGL